MRHLKYGLMLSGCLGLLVGCATVKTPNTFTFVPDFPPDFKYELKAIYLPAKGETCRLPGKRDFWVSFNKPTMEYVSTAEIDLYRKESDCPLALNYVEIKIIGVIGRDQKRTYSSYDYASFAVRPELQERHRGSIDDDGAGRFFGECQWLFRTVGPKRYITKILTCKRMDPQGNLGRGHPFTAYTLTQLPGKTVELQIRLAAEEEPYMGDTWVKVPGGWKRCMGKSFEDQHAFCYGNQTDFSTFRMVDERVCTIYPSCAESKDDAP
ncbi:hypothetical protein [Pseudomonas koreensis]|uniref:hypothetical protein n=1 Tax=Pseudomonas koreensis TaxID=198620 RepID=UPI002FCC3BD6